MPILRPAVAVKARLGKREKLGGKPEAILTGLYTIAPAVHTPQSMVASLFKQPRFHRAAHSRLQGVSTWIQPWQAIDPAIRKFRAIAPCAVRILGSRLPSL
jgi:hypothetical protein